MYLTIMRQPSDGVSTLGTFYLDGEFECYTLEDADRFLETVGCSAKVYGSTCIPRGTYSVTYKFSPSHARNMPHINNVPCFDGILLHIGNSPKDTKGCILLGMQEGQDFISHSAEAFQNFLSKLTLAIDNKEDITLEII